MIKINLIPEEFRRIEKSRRFKINLAALAGVGVVVSVIIIVVALSIVGRRLSREARARARINELKPQAEEAEKIIKLNKQIENELAALGQLDDRRLIWSSILNEISDAVPDQLFLVKLNYRAVAPYTMLIRGEVISERGGERIIEFIDNIRSSRNLIREFPRISYSIESVGEARKTFEVRCSHVTGGKG